VNPAVANLPVLIIALLLFWIFRPRGRRIWCGPSGHVRAGKRAEQGGKKQKLA
jgi:hypothetical protein